MRREARRPRRPPQAPGSRPRPGAGLQRGRRAPVPDTAKAARLCRLCALGRGQAQARRPLRAAPVLTRARTRQDGPLRLARSQALRVAPVLMRARRSGSNQMARWRSSTRVISNSSCSCGSEGAQRRCLSERVRHDSVSTVAFKFKLNHLFHIFKFDAQEFGLGTT